MKARVAWRARLLMMAASEQMPVEDALRWVPLATELDLDRIRDAWRAGQHVKAWDIARDVAALEPEPAQ